MDQPLFFLLRSSCVLLAFAVMMILVSSTYIIAFIVTVLRVIADTSVAAMFVFAIMLSSMQLMVIHMGPAAPLP